MSSQPQGYAFGRVISVFIIFLVTIEQLIKADLAFILHRIRLTWHTHQ